MLPGSKIFTDYVYLFLSYCLSGSSCLLNLKVWSLILRNIIFLLKSRCSLRDNYLDFVKFITRNGCEGSLTVLFDWYKLLNKCFGVVIDSGDDIWLKIKGREFFSGNSEFFLIQRLKGWILFMTGKVGSESLFWVFIDIIKISGLVDGRWLIIVVHWTMIGKMNIILSVWF